MEKKKNFKIVLICEDLNIKETCELYSPPIAKVVKKKEEATPPKAILNISLEEVIFEIVELWESGKLVVPNGNGPEALGNYIYRTIKLRKKSKSKGYVSLSYIKQMIYRIKRKD